MGTLHTAYLLLLVSLYVLNGCAATDEFVPTETISTTPVISDTSPEISDGDVFNVLWNNFTQADDYNSSEILPQTTQKVPSFETTSFYENEDSGYLPTEIFKEEFLDGPSKTTTDYSAPTTLSLTEDFTSRSWNTQYTDSQESLYSTELSSTEDYSQILESSTESSSLEYDRTLESFLRDEYGSLYQASEIHESVAHSTVPSISFKQDKGFTASLDRETMSIGALNHDTITTVSTDENRPAIGSLVPDTTPLDLLDQDTVSPISQRQDTSSTQVDHDPISTVSQKQKTPLMILVTSTTPDSHETVLPASIAPTYKAEAPITESSTEVYHPKSTTHTSNISPTNIPQANDVQEATQSPAVSRCYDGPNVGACMNYKQCFLSGGETFAICKDGRFCCKLHNVDTEGVAYACGLRSRSLVREAKIIGGVEASFGEFPWQAYVFFSRGRAFCGGTLISNQWLITAAHCVYGLPSKYIHVRLGEYDLSHKFEPLAPINRNVKRVILHPEFNARGENDIALLQLNSPVEMQPNVIPICLPKASTSYTNKMGIATGWGTTEWKGFTSNILQKVSLPIISEEKCKLLVEGYHSSFLCAGYIEGTADSCLGDSGGPLQVRDTDGRFHLAGVVSWGEKCAQKGKVGVYASVAKFLPWITGHTKVKSQ